MIHHRFPGQRLLESGLQGGDRDGCQESEATEIHTQDRDSFICDRPHPAQEGSISPQGEEKIDPLPRLGERCVAI
jgi:hypothetical protein